MVKRLFSLFLALMLAFSCVSIVIAVDGDAYDVSVVNTDDTMTKLDYLIKKFPHGKYWNHMGSSKNNPEGVTDTPCSSHSNCDYYGGCSCNSYDGTIQCMGYANQIAYEITGVDRKQYEESSTLDVSKLRVGDIIREGGHSVCVTGVNGNKISITDCNYGARCIIRWITVDKSWFTRVEYVLHCKTNNRVNSNVNFHDEYKNGNTPVTPPPSYDDDEGTTAPTNPTNPSNPSNPTNPPSTPAEKGESWQMEKDSALNIRSSASTGASLVGSVPAGGIFNVYEKSFDGEYLWARVEYNGTQGYSVLNYASYVSGTYETAELSQLKDSYNTRDGINLTWKKVSGADRYNVNLYDSKGKLLEAFKCSGNSYTIKDKAAGNYLVGIAATNSLTPSWIVEGERKALELKQVVVKATAMTLRKTGNLEAGKSGQLAPTFTPSDTTDKTVTWKSSNPKVVTVDSDGLVKAITSGTAVITCTSNQNPKLTASCKFTVKPSSVTTVQTVSGTTENSIGLKWNKSTGATGYYIYRYNTSTKKNVKIGETKNTYYTDKGLKADTEYAYIVRPVAILSSGGIGGNYKSFSASTLPSKVTGVKQAGTDTGRVKLTWNKAKTDVYGYVVYRYDTAKKKYVKLAVAETNSYIAMDSPAKIGKYRIVAAVKLSDGYGFSTASDVFSGITGLAAPTVKTASDKSNVKLTWSKVPYATHYQVYRLSGGKKVLVKTVTADTTSYTDKNLKSATEYTYYVRAARVHSQSLNLFSNQVSVKVKTK